METAKVDVRKLQLLNDRINQTLDALHQVRLSIHALQYVPETGYGFGAGIPGAGFPGAGFQGAGFGYPTPWSPFAQMQQPFFGMQSPFIGSHLQQPWAVSPWTRSYGSVMPHETDGVASRFADSRYGERAYGFSPMPIPAIG